MKKVLIIVAAAFTFFSCGSQKEFTPLQKAVLQRVEELTGEPLKKVEMSEMVLIDSSSFSDEFERRRGTFELKATQLQKLVDKYTAERKFKNASIQRESLGKTQGILASLDSIRNAMGSTVEEIAFYDYKFCVKAECENSVVDFKEAYASITPDGEILSFTTKERDIHKSTGTVIPGYSEILHGEDDLD